jgi:hypothetical protein
MNAMVLLLAMSAAPPALMIDEDVCEIEFKGFTIPITIDPRRAKEVGRIQCFVSSDQGKTWKPCGLYKKGTTGVDFLAPRDGVYWFALQITGTDGRKEPESVAKLVPGQKVLVNSEKRAYKVSKKPVSRPPTELELLREEVKRLRERVEKLEREKGKAK